MIIKTVGILIRRESDNKFLLVSHLEGASHLNGTYGLPAGRVENNESYEEAVLRECFEETGLKVNLEDLFLLPKDWYAKIERKTGTKELSMKVFISSKFSGEIKNSDETEPKWISLSDLNNLNLLPNIKDVINFSLNYFK